MKLITPCSLLALCCFDSVAAVNWQQASLTYLYGTHYRIGDPKRHVLTLEHAANTSWGDSFLFIDHRVRYFLSVIFISHSSGYLLDRDVIVF